MVNSTKVTSSKICVKVKARSTTKTVIAMKASGRMTEE